MHRPTRRQFCRVLAGSGAALTLAGGGWLFLDRGRPVRRTSTALGANVSLTVAGVGRLAANRAIDDALGELDRIESLMSLYRPDSALCRLNREKKLDNPPAELVEVLRAAQALAARTQGAFDVTVQPLWTLYAERQRAGRLPTEDEIAAARRNVDWRRLEISIDRIELRQDMAVTLNGIAQGFAADRVIDVLRRHGVEHALVDTGEIGSLGLKTSDQPWQVSVPDPRRPEQQAAIVSLAGRCLSTSGDYATRFDDQCRNHHVFDPRTGRSPTVLSSVSVAAGTACEADAVSTAVMVLGPEGGLDLIARTPGTDALLVLKDGRTLATAGFPQA